MKIEVGKKYKTRDGDIVEVVSHKPSYSFPFRASNGQSYIENGYWNNERHLCGEDLVEEVEEVEEVYAPEEDQPPLKTEQALLDAFAGLAMQGIIQSRKFSANNMMGIHPAGVATQAYDFAEAMIEERKRRINHDTR